MKLKTLLILYNLLISFFFVLTGIFSAHNTGELVSSLIFLPLIFYFTTTLLKRFRRVRPLKPLGQLAKAPPAPIANTPVTEIPALEPEEIKDVIDVDRRVFLKLIGSAGVTLFMFALFTKKAQAAFFGSVPGPGIVGLKDSAGNKIDPAIKKRTDGYKISQIDDASPAFYGFIDPTGAWYIQKEDSTGNYRYTKGSTSFSTNWTNRATLTYDYFNIVFP